MTHEPRHRTRPGARWSIRFVAAQLLLSLVISAAVGVAVVSYDQMVRRSAVAQIQDTAGLTEAFLRQKINQASGALVQVARQPGVAEALRHPELASSKEEIRTALLVMSLADQDAYSALVTDAEGIVLGNSPAIVPVGFDVSTRRWFMTASRPGVTSDLSPVFESAVTAGLYLTTISVPVQDGGDLVGVLTIAQRLDWYEQFVGGYTAARGVRLAIVDQDGSVVTDGAGRLPVDATQEQRETLGHRLLSSDDRTIRASSAAGVATTSGRWRVVAEIPKSSAMRPARIFAAVSVGAGLIVVLGLNLIVWLRWRAALERDRAAARIRESRHQLKELADSSPDLLFRMKSDGTVSFASRASLAVLGIPAPEMIGQDLVSMLEPTVGDDLRARIGDLVETGGPVSVVARTGPAGRRRIVEVEIIAAEHAEPAVLLGSLRDVTDRRSAQDQVERLFQLTQEFMAVIDFDGRLVRVNPVWEALLERQERSLIGHSFFLFFTFDDAIRARQDFDRMTANGRVLAFENRYLPPFPEPAAGAGERTMRWTMAADRDRQLVYAVGHDITQHKDLERALGEARDEAVATSRMKSEFVATMSHEIRTPMNGVIGLTDLLQGTVLDTNQRRYVDGVRTAGEALLSVINDILDFSKIEAGRMVLEEVDFRPREVVDEVITLVRQSATSKGLSLELDVDPAVPSTVNGDPGRVRQLLLNLVHNAVKFTAEGGVTLRARPGTGTPPVPVLHPDLHPSIVFEVVDTGIGIAPYRLEELFEPFAQADAGTNREYGGTGLGLSICRRLAELMSGTLTASSALGEGTTFATALTFRRPTNDGSSRPGDARSLTVLVLDADESRRQVMAAQLTGWGMRPLPVGSPDEAVMALSWTGATASGADLAIVDLGICPDGQDCEGTGVGLIRAVRAIAGLDAVPIIAVGDQELRASDVLELGITAVLRRPVQPSAIFDALTRVSLARAGQTIAPEPMPGLESGSGGRRLLLAEDNEINQMVALGMLGRLGYEVDVATDGLEAVRMAGEKVYAAVLMDCQMPRMDGYAATRELRGRERTGRIPIIALTAATMPSDRQRCLEAGMDDFIAKPVRFSTLRETLSQWLSGPATDADGARHGAPDVGTVAAGLRHLLPTPREEVAPTETREGADAPIRPADEDIAARLEELLGDGTPEEQELVRDVVASFENRAPELAAKVLTAFADQDLAAVSLHAHALAGAALNLGASAIAAVCLRIEVEARADRLERAGLEAAGLQEALAVDLPRLRSVTSRCTAVRFLDQ